MASGPPSFDDLAFASTRNQAPRRAYCPECAESIVVGEHDSFCPTCAATLLAERPSASTSTTAASNVAAQVQHTLLQAGGGAGAGGLQSPDLMQDMVQRIFQMQLEAGVGGTAGSGGHAASDKAIAALPTFVVGGGGAGGTGGERNGREAVNHVPTAVAALSVMYD